MNGFELEVAGPFDLEAAARFLEGWPPTAQEADHRKSLRWSACIEGTWAPISVEVLQEGSTVLCEYEGTATVEEVAAHVSRVLSVDVDGSGLEEVASRDSVAGELIRMAWGLRPVCFWTPYEAAAWGVMSQRTSMAEASIVKQRIAREHGEPTAYRETFPSPLRLLTLERFSGLPPVKINRLRAIAQAALDGRLDASHLRSLEVSTAIEDLQEIEGVGPFTAELVLVRGAGHPDVFPLHERRLHAAMRLAYGRGDADVEELAKLAQAWAPYRSWVSFLFRSKAAQNG